MQDLAQELNQCLNLHVEDAGRKMKTRIDQYFVSHLFGPDITNRRTYDVVRDMCASLLLVNHGLFKEDDLNTEVVYLTSWLVPPMRIPSTVSEVSELALNLQNKLLISSPSSLEFRNKLIRTFLEVYRSLSPEAVLGFIKIYDLRNGVCRKLRIPDRVFDQEFKTIYKQHTEGFSLDYAFEIFTSKKLPIVMEKPIRGIYNLIRLHEEAFSDA